MNLNEIGKNNKHFREIITFALTTAATIIIAFLLSFVPNILNTEYITSNYTAGISNYIPETSEKLQYMICTVTFPLLYLIFYVLISKISIKSQTLTEIKLLDIHIFIAVIALVILVIGKDPFYLGALKVSDNILINIASVILAGNIVLFCIHQYESSSKKQIWNIILLLCGITASLYAAWIFLTKTYYFGEHFTSYHFDAYFYPIYKVYSGQTPIIDFQNIYGFYPYFIVPILRLMGGATMMRFSLIVCALVAISLLSIYFSFTRLCKNRIIPVLGICTVICWSIVFELSYNGYFIQYIPHRVIFPTLFLFLCTIQVTTNSKKTEKRTRLITFAVIAAALLWNLDSGIVLVIAYPAFLIYRELTVHSFKDKKFRVETCKILLGSLFSAVGAYVILLITTYARTGEIFHFTDIFFGQAIFYKYGFFMIRMPLIHEWILLVAVYAVALTKALKNMTLLRRGENIRNYSLNSIYFLLAVLGMGLFSYYQGRSHDYVFVMVCWPAFIIITLFAQEYLEKIIKARQGIGKTDLLEKLKFLVIIVLIASMTGVYLVSILDNTKMALYKDKHTEASEIKDDIEIRDALDVIHLVRKNYEPLNLIMMNAVGVYCSLQEKWTEAVPARIDVFLLSDVQQIVDSIANANSIVIFDQSSFDIQMTYENENTVKELTDLYQVGQLIKGYYVFVPKSFPERIESEFATDVQLK